ncbi:hypothetical protein Pyn_29709 [Prunus yedoensis var. nudiflora]|uniref:Thylakoid lumenal 15 kDa protein 1 chloroplastic n=1 Tax=Prunus yedoensis var. nudiflora TaxID=2094558 RepID=A0A314YJ47_PRUYE|nr:hypothetical protein Pyn_29709 [Prunus yedoensis var. nudiflora]
MALLNVSLVPNSHQNPLSLPPVLTLPANTSLSPAILRPRVVMNHLEASRNVVLSLGDSSDLTGKDFSGKTLIKQDFKTSILRQANFRGAKLLGASFFDADLTDFTDVPLREDQREYLCKIADGVNPTTGNPTRETLLCN